MTGLTTRTVAFFRDNLPSGQLLALGALPAFAWAFACLTLAGHLKTRRGWRTGYTRKVFHFLIFGSVVAIQAWIGLRGVCLFGVATSLVVFWAVLQGDGHPLYEAMAREKDAPHRTYFILTPYLATLIGGLAASILFDRGAAVGFLVTGLGDAIGEPVGTRFGRHPYRVPAPKGVVATRTWEGSAAVYAACLVALVIAVWLIPAYRPSGLDWGWLPIIALASAAVEAIAPHGWDNALLQVVPSWLTWLTLGAGGAT